MTRTLPRAARAALFTALLVLLSVSSHVLLTRAPLPTSTVALVAAGVFVLAWAGAGRERGTGAIAALLVPLELAADTLFTSGQHFCYGNSGGPVTGTLRAVGLDVLCGESVGAPLARAAGGVHAHAPLPAEVPALTPWLLLATHVSVGLLAAAWLARGERALAALLRAIAVHGFRPLRIAFAAAAHRGRPRPRSPRGVFAAGTFRSRLGVHRVRHRGPPSAAALAL